MSIELWQDPKTAEEWKEKVELETKFAVEMECEPPHVEVDDGEVKVTISAKDYCRLVSFAYDWY